MIQELLAKAERIMDEASSLADEIGIEISFRGLRYIPAQTICGRWEGPEQSHWQPSNMEC